MGSADRSPRDSSSSASPRAQHQPGQTLAQRYRLERLLGAGSLGEVWLARDEVRAESVALKCLTPDAASRAAYLREEFTKLSRLLHPNIVAVHDFGVLPDGIPYFTMEWVEGKALTQALDAGNSAALLAAIEALCSGLGAIHGSGFVHGDVKPENVLIVGGRLESPNQVRLVDLSLAGRAEDPGVARGTPGFVAPEVIAGEPPSQRSDLYGIGATLYTALAGRSPFSGETADEVLRNQRSRDPSPVPLRAAGISPEIERAILRLLARDPSERPNSTADLWQSIAPRRRIGSKVRPSRGTLARGALVGREDELKKVEESFGIASPPVLLSGAPGIGRSRLLRELAVRAELVGGQAVVVSCAGRADGGREWLRRMAVLLQLPDRDATWPAVLAALPAKQRLFLAFEDLHLAAATDLEVARQALASTIPAQATVVLSWADPAPATAKEFDDFLLLARGPWLRQAPATVELFPLGEGTSASLVHALLGEASLAEVDRAVWGLSGGVPGWIEAALISLIDRGALVQEAGRWRVAPGADLLLPLPQLEQLVGTQVSKLSSEARRWLAALDLLGGEAESERVSAVAQTSGEVESEAVSTGLALAEPHDRGTCVRSQPRIAGELARRSLEPEVIREMSERAAELLADEPERAARLWLEAGRPERALEALPTLADSGLPGSAVWARARLRLEARESLSEVSASHLEEAAFAAEAAQRFADAGRLWERFARSSDLPHAIDSARGLLKAAESYRWLADYKKVDPLLDECDEKLAPLYESLKDQASAIRAGVLNERAWLDMVRGNLEAAERAAREALEVAPATALPERFAAWNRLAVIHQYQGRLDDADRAIAEALQLAGTMNDGLAEIRAHSNAVAIAHTRNQVSIERYHLQRNLQLSEKLGLSSITCRALSGLVTLLQRTGTVEEIRRGLRNAEEKARSVGDLLVLSTVIHNAAKFELRQGEIRRSEELTRANLRLATRIGNRLNKGWSWNRLGMIASLKGHDKRAARLYRRALRIWEAEAYREATGYTLANLAELLLEAGQIPAAKSLLERAAAESRSFPATSAWVVRPMVLLAAKAGNIASARAAISSQSEEQLFSDPESLGNLKESQAIVAIMEGDVSRAIDLWRETDDLYQSASFPLARARNLATAGKQLSGFSARTRDHSRVALDWLREARSIYERLGARGPLFDTLSDLSRLNEEMVSGENPPPAGSRDTLYQVSELINSILDFPELIQKTLHLVAERLKADRGLIVLVDPDSRELNPVAQFGSLDEDARADALQVSTSIVRRVAESGSAFRSDDAAMDPRLSTLKSVFELSLRSVVCVALRQRDQVIGTIYLQNNSSRGAFSDADIAFLESFSNLIAVAIENSRLHETLRQSNELLVDENVNLRKEVKGTYRYSNLVGRSSPMGEVQGLIERFAESSGDVLIQGETGTGKELVAKTIHFNSSRRERPFLTISCVALPESLIEAELFGIDDHVATGVRARQGVFERAEGGSVLLDEIGDMPVGMQAKLLRVLQEREFTRVGGRRPIRMNVRILAATNADLRDRVKQERFRPDLFFRVNRLVIHLPPLRDRKADLPILARHFVEKLCERVGRPVPKLSTRLLSILARSSWPGNVRELENYLERLLVVSDGQVLEPKVLPGDLEETASSISRPGLSGLHGTGAPSLDHALQTLERDLIQEALEKAGGNQSQAARILGLAEPTLRYRLRKLGVPVGGATARSRGN